MSWYTFVYLGYIWIYLDIHTLVIHTLVIHTREFVYTYSCYIYSSISTELMHRFEFLSISSIHSNTVFGNCGGSERELQAVLSCLPNGNWEDAT